MGTYTNYSKLEVDGTISSSVQGELIGTFTSMPSASARNVGKTIYYTGATSGNYVQNTFYTCTKSGSTYSWTSASPKQISVDSALSTTSTNPVQNKVIANALKDYATKDDIATVYKPKGSIASANLPSNPRVGDVYNLTDNSSYGPAGTNVVYTENGWDALAGIVDISGKQDKISAGTGISLSGNTVSLATSGVTAGSKGGTTAVPVITVDAYGRITSISTNTIYPPTTAGSSGQIWTSDGSGQGGWKSKDTTPTSGSINAITSGAVYTALAGKQNNLTFDSTPTQNSSNPVTSGGIYNMKTALEQAIGEAGVSITGAASSIVSSNLTASRALISNSNGKVAVSTVTSTELGYLDGVTSAIQTQLDGKLSSIPSAGSSTTPIYIDSSGKPTACNYTLGAACAKSVTTSVSNGSTSLVTSGGVYTAVNAKQNKLTFDSSPKSGSSNPVTSGGIYTAINDVSSSVTSLQSTVAGKQDKLTFDSSPTQNSGNPVTSGGVYTAVNNVNSSVTSLQSTVAGKQDKLTFDSSPKSGSSNPVTSGGIYTALAGKQNKLTFDSSPKSGSSNPVTSGGIYTAINDVSSSVTSLQSTVAGKQDKLTFDSSPKSGSSNPVTSGGIFSAINGKQNKNLKFENKSASSWASDTEFADYPYKCTIALSGVDSSDYAEVVFRMTEATSGNYAPICRTYNGGVYIWGKVNTAITINVIVEVF